MHQKKLYYMYIYIKKNLINNVSFQKKKTQIPNIKRHVKYCFLSSLHVLRSKKKRRSSSLILLQLSSPCSKKKKLVLLQFFDWFGNQVHILCFTKLVLHVNQLTAHVRKLLDFLNIEFLML